MKMEFSNGYFDGEVDDKGNFTGKIVYNNGDVYEGRVVDGVFSGKVTIHYDYGVYSGEWKDGDKNGTGTMTWSDGDVYEGDFLSGTMHGVGKFTWANGDVYVGEWKGGTMSGKGKLTWGNKCEYYEGEFSNGERHGKGIYRNPNGNLFEETFLNGERQTSIRIDKEDKQLRQKRAKIFEIPTRFIVAQQKSRDKCLGFNIYLIRNQYPQRYMLQLRQLEGGFVSCCHVHGQ